MSGEQRWRCPECGEDAVRQPPSDLVPWEAHGLSGPEWSHRDGSSLCPVTGPSGGYQPAQPQPTHPQAAPPEPDTSTMRIETHPAGMARAGRTWPG